MKPESQWQDALCEIESRGARIKELEGQLEEALNHLQGSRDVSDRLYKELREIVSLLNDGDINGAGCAAENSSVFPKKITP